MNLRAQSLVEFALIAPIVVLLAMAAWDGGSVLREQVVLQQAARDGARVAATTYGGAASSIVQDAVLASAADLPALQNTPGYFNLSSDAQSVTVRLVYTHPLITPVLRQLWGGGLGAVTLSASATFYLPWETPVPAVITPSTPVPTSTPTPTLTPTPLPTATPTPTPIANVCTRVVTIPPLDNNTGFYATLQLTVDSQIGVGWTIPVFEGGSIQLYLYNATPFAGSPDPTTTDPPPNAIASGSVDSNQSTVVSTVSPTEPPGTYSVYFFKRGVSLDQSSEGALGYVSGNCS